MWCRGNRDGWMNTNRGERNILCTARAQGTVSIQQKHTRSTVIRNVSSDVSQSIVMSQQYQLVALMH